ncbi:MAG: DNA methylase, partial [Clostridia bacterium]|nr:DNA methylase [Clostridia bacterium]
QDGIEYFSQYYLRRTLISLCAIKDKIKEPLYNSLLTKVAFQLTIMYRFRKKGGSPLAGTMYVPALMKELNIFNQLSAFITARGNVSISDDSDVIIGTQSSTNLWAIKENSIDYIFTDPPFGSNLMYSELNFLSEMWLKVLTDNGKECIENDTQGKDVNIYKSIISEVFGQYYRVLKYNHWLSVEFSNTSAEVWQSIRSAIKNAGFLIGSVSVVDKKTKTYKAITTRTAVNNDLVISCYKPTRRLEESFNNDKTDPQNIWMFVEEFLDHLPVHYRDEDKTTAIQERSPKILFDRLIAYYVQHGYPVPMSASEFQKGLKERFVERDGMYFTSSQALEYETKKKETTSFVGLALLVGSEAEGIEWLKNRLGKKPMTYQEIQPEWMRDLVDAKKGDTIPELMQILEENFIRDEDGRWHIPDINNQAELEAMRNKRLLKEFDGYVASKRIRDARLEALRAGFKNCYEKNDFATILAVADKIPESLLMEDEVLVMYYDIASARA